MGRRPCTARPPSVRATPIRGWRATPCLARYALHAAALPRAEFGLFIAEDVRRALMSRAQEPSSVLSGRDAGRPRSDGHQHAFYLPEDSDGDGHLDRVTVFAREGFGPDEVHALSGFRVLYRHGGGGDIQLLLEHLGPLDLLPVSGARIAGESDTWISTTPFVLGRHPKKDGRDGPVAQLRRELAFQGFPEPIEVDWLEAPNAGRGPKEWRHFRRHREARPPAASSFHGRSCFGFRVRFADPVRGPIAVGYGCHFGLGLFRPVMQQQPAKSQR